MRSKIVALFFLLILFSSCQPSSFEEFEWEGASCSKSLIKELQGIRNREDLSKAESVLKKHFEKMVNLMIQARVFFQKNPYFEPGFSLENQQLNALLFEEMQRVYALEGGKECIEKAQKEAMLRLHAKEKIWTKQHLPQLK